ncbi:MAG: transglutaminase-like domain-containing protein, partial [Nitrosarchaeum sp.]|nr:transglutaminase-like domain-containing protein [Nitrosarchaeum sp.]
KSIAQKVTENEDDLWIVVSKIAQWVKENVQYDLSTLNEEVSQKASSVLSERKGVCREITTLFVAMLRSLEIPARFINGVVYTEQFKGFSAHQWAEVYFPETGWVPFDVTLGQFGWVDNSHVKFIDSIDPKIEEYKFSIRGKDVEIKLLTPKIFGEIISNSGDYPPELDIDVHIFQERTGFDSYNLVEVEVRNIADYYQTAELKLAKVNELEFIDGTERHLILKPGEFKKLFFTLKTKKELFADKSYEIPIQISTGRDQIVLKKITVTAKDIVYGQTDITKALAFALEEQEKEYSNKVKFACVPDVKEFYDDQYVNVKCTFNNEGYDELKDLQICLQRNCRKFDVKQNNLVETKFTIDVPKFGKQDLMVIARNDQVSTNTQFTIEKLDAPVLKIKNLKYPKRSNESVISFDLSKESYSNPSKVNVSLKFNNNELNQFYDKV